MTGTSPALRRPRLRPALVALAVGALLAAGLPAQAAQAATPTASDDFSRSTTGGWGTATTGGAWTTWSSGPARFDVASGQGVVSGLAPGASVTAVLRGTSTRDAEVADTVTLPAGQTVYHAWELRLGADGSSYRARLEQSARGTVALVLSKVVARVETPFARTALPADVRPGATVRVAFTATGDSPVALGARAWAVDGADPGWQVVATDSAGDRLQRAGWAGLWQYASTGNQGAATTTHDALAVAAASGVPTLPATQPEPTPTPTPTPTPQPEPDPEPEATSASGPGSVPVGSARYAVPAGAVVVATTGRDGAAGTASAPLATVAAAIARAPQGGTVVLRAGTYNQSVVVPFGKKVTVQAWPGEAVWFDGSQRVTAWTKQGSTWTTPWSTFPSNKVLGVADNPRFVQAGAPLAARPDQLFLDGVAQRQVASAAQVVAGTFYPDPSGRRVVFGTDPAGHEVRISNKTQAFHVQGAGTTLQGFGVRRYATTDDERGTVRLGNDDLTARDLVLEDNAMIGLALERNRGTLERITARRNGMLGINASTAYDLSLTDSLVTGNNAQQFKTAPVAGGVKITRSRGVTVRGNDVSRNTGGGIWLDESVYDARVVGNAVVDNTWFGIQLELSSKAVVADNVVTGGEVGVHLFDANGVDVVNNSIGGFSKMGVKIEQDERRQATSGTGQDPRRPKPDPTVTWVTGDITVANNAFGTGGWFQVYVLDKATHRSADSMGIDIVGNAFNQRVTTSQATLVGWGAGDNATVRRFDSVAALVAAKPAWRNVQTTGVVGLGSMLSFLTAQRGVAVPLTSEWAALLGQPAGTRRIGAF